MNHQWTPNDDKLIADNYHNPLISAAQLAQMIGVSKNALIGRANRLGLARAANDNTALISLAFGRYCPKTQRYYHHDEPQPEQGQPTRR